MKLKRDKRPGNNRSKTPEIKTITIAGEVLRFRAPSLLDCHRPAQVAMLARDFPQLGNRQAAVVIIGACYVPDENDPKEKNVDATQLFAKIACENDAVFVQTFFAFKRAFPDFILWKGL